MTIGDLRDIETQVEIIQSSLDRFRQTSYELVSKVPMCLESPAGQVTQDLRKITFEVAMQINYLLAILGYDEQLRLDKDHDPDFQCNPIYEKEDTEEVLLSQRSDYSSKVSNAGLQYVSNTYGAVTAETVEEFVQAHRAGKVRKMITQTPDSFEVWFEKTPEGGTNE